MEEQKDIEMEKNQNVTYFDMNDKEFNKQFKFLTHYFVKNSIKYHDAENLAMESMEKAMRTFNPLLKTKITTHIHNVRNTTLFDFVKNKQYKQQQITTSLHIKYDDDDSDERNMDISDPTPGIDVLMDKKILYRIIKIYIDKLNPLEKNIIMDRYFDDLTYEEITKKHDIASGTMKVTLSRAKDKLKNALMKNKGFRNMI